MCWIKLMYVYNSLRKVLSTSCLGASSSEFRLQNCLKGKRVFKRHNCVSECYNFRHSLIYIRKQLKYTLARIRQYDSSFHTLLCIEAIVQNENKWKISGRVVRAETKWCKRNWFSQFAILRLAHLCDFPHTSFQSSSIAVHECFC